MYRIIFLIGFIFLFQQCNDVSDNQRKELTSHSQYKLPCGQLSNEKIYEMSITYIKNELGIKNEYTINVESHGDTVLYVKLIPVKLQLGGTIDLKIMTKNCEISVLTIGK